MTPDPQSGLLEPARSPRERRSESSDKSAAAPPSGALLRLVTLAASPDIRNLELLNLSGNELTEVGKVALKGLGIPVEYGSQYVVGSGEYLYSGDME